MFRVLLLMVAVDLMPLSVFAQRDPPVWETYLASLSIYHEDHGSITVGMLYKHEGGPYEHYERQMYLLAYLKLDEAEILKIASDRTLLDKTKPDKMSLDVLLERKLVTILETKAAKKNATTNVGDYDVNMERRDKTARFDGKASLGLNTFRCTFVLKNEELFKAISRLANFDEKRSSGVNGRIDFDDGCGLIAAVPVNDCKYATKVEAKLRKTHDFAEYADNLPFAYFRPLPYELQFRKNPGDVILAYIR